MHIQIKDQQSKSYHIKEIHLKTNNVELTKSILIHL